MNIKELPNYIDARGKIQMVIESAQVGSISIIDSEPNSTRANHYHPDDEHTILITKGQIEYYERERLYTNKGLQFGPINRVILNEGDLYHTRRQFEHTMYFPCANQFICFSKLPRTQENYEKETIKIDFDLRQLYNNWVV